ncbi:MAG: hypothetical protein AAF711_13085 [Planctomycetota bacterium]
MKPIHAILFAMILLGLPCPTQAFAKPDIVDQALDLLDDKKHKEAMNLLSEAATDERMEDPRFMLAIADAARLYAPEIEPLNGGDRSQAEYFNAAGIVYRNVLASDKADEEQQGVAEINLLLLKNVVYRTAVEAKQEKRHKQVARLASVLGSVWPDDLVGPIMLHEAGKAMEDESVQLLAMRMYVNAKPEDLSVYTYAAMIEESMELGGGAEAALEHLNAGLEVIPDSMELMRAQATLLIEMGRVDEARKTVALFDKTAKKVEDEAQRAPYMVVLGLLYENLNEVEEAERCYLWALQRKPDMVLGQYNLGAIYYARAGKLYAEADAAFLDDKDAYNKLNKKALAVFALARKHLEAAYMLDEPDLSIMYALQSIYHRLGDEEALLKMRRDIRRVENGEKIR